MTHLESAFGAYAPLGVAKRAAWLSASIAENFIRVLKARNHDLVFLQRNLTATLATWERYLQAPFVFDVDDAIFVGSRGRSAERIARRAAVTICGNLFLADYFSSFGKVRVLPTAVDDEVFTPRNAPLDRPVIGWSGSSSGLEYLYSIEPSIERVLQEVDGAILKVVSDREPHFRRLDPAKVVFEKWTERREVESLHDFAVGVMPLTDSVWTRGKCSYKMLTYMAVGIPVVVSPVGMNVEVLACGSFGYAARNDDEWVQALIDILKNPELAATMGLTGRSIVETRYSKRVIGPQLVEVFRKIVSGGGE